MKKTKHLLRHILALTIGLSPMLAGAQVDSNNLASCLDGVVSCYGSGPGMVVADIKRVGDPLNGGASLGANWMPPSHPRASNPWVVDSVGQVFGIAIDDLGSIYLAATSMYYNPLGVPGGSVPRERLAISSPSVYSPLASTNFYSGYHPVGGPAGIYKTSAGSLTSVNVLTGSSTTATGTGLGTARIFDHGYGIGNICADRTWIYATVLDDGSIYKIDASTGIIDQIYDPFGADVSGVQMAPFGERVIAIGVAEEASSLHRLYFSLHVDSTTTDIYSVPLQPNGDISNDPPEFEVSIYNRRYFYISDIAFSTKGNMLVAEKGDPHNASVYEYKGHHRAWSQPYIIPAGTGDYNSAGGVDYAGAMDANGRYICDTIAWATANAMVVGQNWWYGLQGVILDNPQNPMSSRFVVDFDGLAGGAKGLYGDFEFYGSCCFNEPTAICDMLEVVSTQDTGCCYKLISFNDYDSTYFSSVIVKSTNGLTISNSSVSGNWGTINYLDPTTIEISNGHSNLPMGQTELGNFCLSGRGSGFLQIYFIGNAPHNDTICVKEVEVGCNQPGQDPTCVDLLDTIICKNGNKELQFTITNLSNWTMRGVTITPLSPGVHGQQPYVNIFVPIADLAPGATGTYSTTVNIDDTVSQACFYYSVCDVNVRPFVSGTTPMNCCMDSIIYCVDVPLCDPCDAISFVVNSQDSTSDDCCYNLDLSNNLSGSQISCVRFRGVGGTQFALFGSTWNIQAPVSSGFVELCAPGGSAPIGTLPDFAQLCLTGTSTNPHAITVEFVGVDGDVVCTQALEFDCDLVESKCLQIVNDSLYCKGDEHYFTFSIKNNSPFDVYQIDVRPGDSSVVTTPSYFQFATPIAAGASAGPYTVKIDTADPDLDFLCISLSAHNAPYDSITGQGASICCTDSLGGICLPFIPCDSLNLCCDVGAFVVPTGVTPNADGRNDELLIGNATECEYVKMTVFNRWGNVVYENANYANDWKGEGRNGTLLPQGTYYILLEVSSGATRGFYVDLRY